MTREEAIEKLNLVLESRKDKRGKTDTDIALEMAISALEKENIYDDGEHYVTISKALYDKLNVDICNDAISREAVIDAIDFYDGYNQQHFTVENLRDDICRLPSVQPSRKGHWEYTKHYGKRYRVCPFCKAEKEDDLSSGWNFCQYCGADMRGEE